MKKKKLDEYLAIGNDIEFFGLIWAVHALQNGRVAQAKKYISYPPEAANSDRSSKLRINEWELETLLSTKIAVHLKDLSKKGGRRLNCAQFNTCASAINMPRKLEDVESLPTLNERGVFYELHRLGQRQFSWQRGFTGLRTHCRHAHVFGQSNCAAYFEEANGISLNDFTWAGHVIQSVFLNAPLMQLPASFDNLELPKPIIDKFFMMTSKNIVGARSAQMSLQHDVRRQSGKSLPIAYQPSILRKFPITMFSVGKTYASCPIPELISLRTTSGLYYDFAGAEGGMRNIIAQNFETYCLRIFRGSMPEYEVRGEFEYRYKGNSQKSTDLFVHWQNELHLLVECKATKLTLEAQYSDNPIAEAHSRYEMIAKGVHQIWKLVSRHRRNFVNLGTVNKNLVGIVLTLETWLMHSSHLYKEIMQIVDLLISPQDEIQKEDRIPVVFCSAGDLEDALLSTDEAGFLAACRAASTEKYQGWMLPTVIQEIGAKSFENKTYPLDFDHIFIWRERMLERQMKQSNYIES